MCLSIKVKRPEDVLSEGVHCGHEWVAVHNGMGYRCGYVKVEPGHPWYRKSDGEIDADVHGGLTFSEADTPCDKGGPDDGWWIGFDCAQWGDAQDEALYSDPVPWPFRGSRTGVVRTQEYVEAECRKLCRQAAAEARCDNQKGEVV